MKKYLKNNEGMALPMVLIIMAILMTFATSLALFAYDSLLSVKWMNAEKKAYYLARAGVEATHQAYQNMQAEKGTDTNIGNLITDLEGDGVLTTATVYLAPTANSDNENTMWANLNFTTELENKENSIGWFVVEIAKGTNEVDVKDGTDADPVTVYKSTASVLDADGQLVTRTAYAYVSDTKFIKSVDAGTDDPLYDENGYLSAVKEIPAQTGAYASHGTNFDSVGIDKFELPTTNTTVSDTGWKGFFKNLANSIVLEIFKAVKGDDFPMYYATYLEKADGNLVLTKPTKSSNILCNANSNNFYAFATSKDLFFQDCGLDTTPTRGYYSCIGLYGRDIVIDGDITMYAYIPKRNLGGLDIGPITNLVATFGDRYRLGTVVIGNGSNVEPQKTDCRTGREGGIYYSGHSDGLGKDDNFPVNRIFFNGNVFLKVEEQGSDVEVYRVFEAGDVAFFAGSYVVSTGALDNAQISESLEGIDLTKYFIDAVLAGQEGYANLGERTRAKLTRVKELYYGGDDASTYQSYVSDENVLIRKVSLTYSGETPLVDSGEGSLDDIVQPVTTGGAIDITWGEPTSYNFGE